jgi:hypothetical protein
VSVTAGSSQPFRAVFVAKAKGLFFLACYIDPKISLTNFGLPPEA